MRVHMSVVLALVARTLEAVPARAQVANRVAITPYVALGTAGALPVGASLTFPLTPKLSLETDLAYRRGEGDINALSSSVGLMWFLPRVGRTTPYLAGGVGLAQYGAPVLAVTGPPIGTV